jgi:hypothetical protein
MVKRLERALRRTPNLGLAVDGVFGPQLEAAVKEFHQGLSITIPQAEEALIACQWAIRVRYPPPSACTKKASRMFHDPMQRPE